MAFVSCLNVSRKTMSFRIQCLCPCFMCNVEFIDDYDSLFFIVVVHFIHFQLELCANFTIILMTIFLVRFHNFFPSHCWRSNYDIFIRINLQQINAMKKPYVRCIAAQCGENDYIIDDRIFLTFLFFSLRVFITNLWAWLTREQSFFFVFVCVVLAVFIWRYSKLFLFFS